MKELVILSGKGGTGKTSLTAAFSSLAGSQLLCDADVDGANLHLLMKPETIKSYDFMSGQMATINSDTCDQCDVCRTHCAFEAITDQFTIDPISCEGCGVCKALCPQNAIEMAPQNCGKWFLSDCQNGLMVHAQLSAGAENSGKLVSLIRKEAHKRAERLSIPLIITDGPPGIGCPVIASVTGATGVLIVVEPTLSGIHDMLRVIKLCNHFHLPKLLCINKFDLNRTVSKKIEELAATHQVPVVGTIPFDPVFTRAMVKGLNIFAYGRKTQLLEKVEQTWDNICQQKWLHSADTFTLLPTNQ